VSNWKVICVGYRNGVAGQRQTGQTGQIGGLLLEATITGMIKVSKESVAENADDREEEEVEILEEQYLEVGLISGLTALKTKWVQELHTGE